MARILVIDDETDVRCFIHMILEEAGHEVLEASNGAEGIIVFQGCSLSDAPESRGFRQTRAKIAVSPVVARTRHQYMVEV